MILSSTAMIFFLSLVAAIAAQEVGDVRLTTLSGRVSRCRGRLQIFGSDGYADVCDRNAGDREAQVVCRQLGCNPVGAREVAGSVPESGFLRRIGFSCLGTESSLFDCNTVTANCPVGPLISDSDEAVFVNIICGISPPSAPRNLIAEGVTATAISLSWDSPVDQGTSFLRGYRISLILDSDGETVERALTDNTGRLNRQYIIRDQGLTELTTYMVQVEAYNGELGPPVTAMATTLSIFDPQMILDPPLISNIQNTSATVSWQFPGGTVDSYLVQYVLSVQGFNSALSDIFSVTVPGTSTSVRIEGLQTRSQYDARVAVQNENGTSTFSPTASFTPGFSNGSDIFSAVPVFTLLAALLASFEFLVY